MEKKNKMKTEFQAVVLIVLAFLWFSCKEKISDPGSPGKETFSYTASACLAHGLAKGSALDSVFEYSFQQSLIVDFSAWSNCCPDSGRFSLSYAVRTDTIIVTVLDTAAHLCHCLCPYMLHVELADLPLDRYIVRCRIGNGQNYDDPIHLVPVNRSE